MMLLSALKTGKEGQYHNGATPPSSILYICTFFQSFFLIQKSLLHKCFFLEYSAFCFHCPNSSPIQKKKKKKKCLQRIAILYTLFWLKRVTSQAFFYLNCKSQSNFRYLSEENNKTTAKKSNNIFLINISDFQSLNFRINCSITGTQEIILYAFYMHEACEVL